MGFTYIDTLTGSLDADNKPAIKMDIPFGNDSSATGTKYFELQRYKNPIFYITKEGAVFASQFTGSVKLTQPTNAKTNTLTYFNGSQLSSTPNLYYQEYGSSRYLNLSSSYAVNILLLDSKGVRVNVPPDPEYSYCVSGVYLSNNWNRSRWRGSNWGPEGWRIISEGSGSLSFSAETGSYQFTNENYTAKGLYDYFTALKQSNNNFYFWSEPWSYSSISRDGAVGIGVPYQLDAKNPSNLKAKLHINMFSASVDAIGKGAWSGTGTVQHRSTAILVQYGSGSLTNALTTNFYVSASGNTYIRGNLNVGGTISKGGGSFDIEHPDPSKEMGWILRHSFVESPTRGDNIYRYNITTTSENLQSTINLPDYYKHLNENSQVWVSPTNCFGVGYGTINEELTQVTITTNIAGNYNVLLIGTRKDKLAKDYWDTKGIEYFDPGNIRFQNRIKKEET